MRKLSKESRTTLGVVSLLLAFVLMTTGGGVTWGITGALWSSGIVAAIYGFAFLISTSES